MENLTDRDMAYDVLYGTKQAAMLFMEATLESASPACRHLFHRLHDDAMRDQWRLWQFLHGKAEYRVEAAGRAEIDGVRRRMEHLWQSHRGTAAAGRGGYENASRGRAGDSARGGWEDRSAWDGAPEGSDWYGAPAGPRYGTPGYAASGSSSSAYGAWNQAESGVAFEPAGALPQDTQFESERGFAAPRAGTAPSAYGSAPSTYGAARETSGRAGTEPGTGAAFGGPAARPAPYAQGSTAYGSNQGRGAAGREWNPSGESGRRGPASSR